MSVPPFLRSREPARTTLNNTLLSGIVRIIEDSILIINKESLL
jgi:hypothetical protein